MKNLYSFPYLVHFFSGHSLSCAVDEVLVDGLREKLRILRDDTDVLVDLGQLQITQFSTINQNAATLRVVKPQNHVDDGGFTACKKIAKIRIR